MPDALRIRPAVRAVVSDPDRRVLLVHFTFGAEDAMSGGFWACPGGGVDAGESDVAALTRELLEELGLPIADPGSPIWCTEHVFPMTRWDGQRDIFFWVPVEAFEPRPQPSPQQLLDENVDAVRWWTYAELQSAQAAYDRGDDADGGYAVLSPRRLGHLVAELFTEGRPIEMRRLDPL